MRLVIAVMLMCSGTPVAADNVTSNVSLSPGETLLEVEGVGVSRVAADRATFTAVLYGLGKTQAEAERVLAGKVAAVSTAARNAGGTIKSELIGRALDPLDLLPGIRAQLSRRGDQDDQTPASASRSAQSRLEVVVSGDVTRLVAVQSAMIASGAEDILPIYELSNPAEARQRAKADALAKARADAESYAKSLNLTLRRLVSVSERSSFSASELFDVVSGGRNLANPLGRPTSTIETRAKVTISYVLAPR